MTLTNRLWLVLLGLSLTDFYLTSNLILISGWDAEANPFMRVLFQEYLIINVALLYKLISYTFLYFAVEKFIGKESSKKHILMSIVFIYTFIVIYSLWLTYM